MGSLFDTYRLIDPESQELISTTPYGGMSFPNTH